MIKYDKRYAAIKNLPGYFWNLDEEAVYSIKIQGVLKRLTEQTGNTHTFRCAGIRSGQKYYELSKNAKSTTRTVEWIRNNLIYEDTISQ